MSTSTTPSNSVRNPWICVFQQCPLAPEELMEYRKVNKDVYIAATKAFFMQKNLASNDHRIGLFKAGIDDPSLIKKCFTDKKEKLLASALGKPGLTYIERIQGLFAIASICSMPKEHNEQKMKFLDDIVASLRATFDQEYDTRVLENLLPYVSLLNEQHIEKIMHKFLDLIKHSKTMHFCSRHYSSTNTEPHEGIYKLLEKFLTNLPQERFKWSVKAIQNIFFTEWDKIKKYSDEYDWQRWQKQRGEQELFSAVLSIIFLIRPQIIGMKEAEFLINLDDDAEKYAIYSKGKEYKLPDLEPLPDRKPILATPDTHINLETLLSDKILLSLERVKAANNLESFLKESSQEIVIQVLQQVIEKFKKEWISLCWSGATREINRVISVISDLLASKNVYFDLDPLIDKLYQENGNEQLYYLYIINLMHHQITLDQVRKIISFLVNTNLNDGMDINNTPLRLIQTLAYKEFLTFEQVHVLYPFILKQINKDPRVLASMFFPRDLFTALAPYLTHDQCMEIILMSFQHKKNPDYDLLSAFLIHEKCTIEDIEELQLEKIILVPQMFWIKHLASLQSKLKGLGHL